MNTEERFSNPENPCRAAIGLLVPARNVVAEVDIHRMMPNGVHVYTARVFNEEPESLRYDADEQDRLKLDGVPEAALRIAEVKPNVVAFCCTSRSFIGGERGNQLVTESIRERVGVPVVTASTAVAQAASALNLHKIALGCPYSEVMIQRLRRLLSAVECEVMRYETIPWETRNREGVALNLARRLDGQDIDGILLSCTNFRAASSVALIEQEIEKPVITSNQATAWACMRWAGLDDRVAGFGALLQLPLSPAGAWSAPGG